MPVGAQRGPFPDGMNDIALSRLPQLQGMEDGVAMFKKGEEK